MDAKENRVVTMDEKKGVEDDADAKKEAEEQKEDGDRMVNFLQSRMSKYESEREAILDRVDALVESRGEEHALLFELRRASDEVHELQRALSDAHAFLFEERGRLLSLRAENDELKVQELEDRARIQHLLRLTAPFEEEVNFERGMRPESMLTRPASSSSGTATSASAMISDSYKGGSASAAATHKRKQKSQGAAAIVKPGETSGSSPTATTTERIMRTIYLPTANTDTLILRIESLQAQLMEQKAFADERTTALLEDRRIRERDAAEAHDRMAARADDLTNRLSTTEALLQRVTRDLLDERRLRDAAEAGAEAEVHGARVARRAADDLQSRLQGEIEAARAKIQAESDEYVDKFRRELRDKEEEVVRMETVYASMKASYERRVADLESRNARLTAANAELESRRAMDVEGFAATVSSLRQKLKSVERKQLTMRLEERVEDEDVLDGLLARISTTPSLTTSSMATAPKRLKLRKTRTRGVSGGASSGAAILSEVDDIRRRVEGIGSIVQAL